MEQIKSKLDATWSKMLQEQALKEYKKIFGGKRFPKITEEEFHQWWNSNKNIPYSTYYYDVLCGMQDLEATFYAE